MRRAIPRFYLFFAAFFASLVFCQVGAAADPPEKPPVVHTVSGFIDSKSLAEFMRLLPLAKANGSVTLMLDSPGGNMGAANRIAGLIGYLERQGVRTRAHVDRAGRCLSACVVILAAGERRTAGRTAWIGLHGLRSAKTGKLNRPAAERMIAYLQRRGISQRWLAELDSDGVFDRHELTSFDGEGLLSTGLVQEIAAR